MIIKQFIMYSKLSKMKSKIVKLVTKENINSLRCVSNLPVSIVMLG